MDELEKKAKEIQDQLKELKAFMDENKELKSQLAAFQELKTKFEALGDMPNADGIKAISDDLNKLNQEVKAFKESKENETPKTLASELKRICALPEFKEAIKNNEFKGLVGKSFELKTDTTAYTGTVALSQVRPGINFPREAALTITPLFNVVPMGQDKSRMVWVEGSYTSNAGYVGEGAAIGTADAGTGVEKSRELAKISAKLILTAEMFEDLSALAARFEMKLTEGVQRFLNKELLSGDGNDTTEKKHIYGLLTQGSTAFVAGGLANAYPLANIEDLVAAAKVQAGVYMPTHVIMNKLTVAKYSRVKDTTGQYVIKEVNGQKILGGLTLVESEEMADEAMLLVDQAVLQLWVKRNLEFKIGQEATDLSSDKYTAVVFWRGQGLVETPDKKANIYIADITTALTAITK